MSSHVQMMCSYIKNYFNVSYDEVLNWLYHSKLYQALEEEDTKMWYYSSYDLFKMFLMEKETGSYSCREDFRG